MNKRRVLIGILLIVIFLQLPIFAAAAEPTFTFELSLNGKTMETAQKGDILTVSLYVVRTDSTEPFIMTAMQSEIAYDSKFHLVEGSEIMKQGVRFRDIATPDDGREFYMNYLSMEGGTLWDARTLVGTFQLEVGESSGTGYITNQDYLIPTQDGTGSYSSTANSVVVEIEPEEPEIPDEPEEPERPDFPHVPKPPHIPDRPDTPKPPEIVRYTVRFDSQGGSYVPDQIVDAGKRLTKPAKPVKSGYTFIGWYTDMECTQRWNFSVDTVRENMTLYAKWISGIYDLIPETSDNFSYMGIGVMTASAAMMMLLCVLFKRRKNK